MNDELRVLMTKLLIEKVFLDLESNLKGLQIKLQYSRFGDHVYLFVVFVIKYSFLTFLSDFLSLFLKK